MRRLPENASAAVRRQVCQRDAQSGGLKFTCWRIATSWRHTSGSLSSRRSGSVGIAGRQSATEGHHFVMKHFRIRSLALLLAASMSFGNQQPQERLIESHGFKIDASRATDQQLKKVMPALRKQLDVIESVRLPKDVVEFFRTVPIVLNPDTNPNSNAAYEHKGGNGVVNISPGAVLPENRPIVLHELLHAFHFQVLKLADPVIARAYNEAIERRVYPAEYAQAHFLENRAEFFAVIGSMFLFGPIQQPPYNCATTRKAQLEFIAYLNEVLGPHQCR
jgi:hypothetical protein